MATRNINNYINELLNEVHEPGHQRERQFFDPTKNPMDGIRDDQKSTKKPLSSKERELAILRAQAKSRTNDMGERLAARKALKAMENQAAPSAPTTTGGMGKEMDKMRDGFLSNLDNFSSGKGITDNLQASGSGKKPKKDTPGREIEKIPVERRPERPVAEPKPMPYYPGGRPDNRRPIGAEPGPIQLPGGRYDDIPKPIGKPIDAGTYTKKPESRESFPSRGGKNKRLARAAQADKTGDAYMAQVMGQGKATAQSEYQKRIDAEKDRIKTQKRVGARPESGIRDAMFRPGRDDQNYGPPRTLDYRPDRDDPIGGYGPAIPRTDLFNRAGGQNLMPVNKPAIAGQKPRSLSGEIESDFIDYRKPKRMR
jgi:hypothetical protein